MSNGCFCIFKLEVAHAVLAIEEWSEVEVLVMTQVQACKRMPGLQARKIVFQDHLHLGIHLWIPVTVQIH